MTNTLPTIMVVDDSQTSISLYQYSVEPLAVDFVPFQDAEQAMAYLKDHKPDLIFLDIVMPGMDGLTFLQRLRALPQHQDTSVVMVTSKNYKQDRSDAKKLNALDFLIKPLKFKEIQAVIYKYTVVQPPAKDVSKS